jgi:hypothetical protein
MAVCPGKGRVYLKIALESEFANSLSHARLIFFVETASKPVAFDKPLGAVPYNLQVQSFQAFVG